jgi:CMP-N-acetylneuraminic acid synthetase
MYKNKTILGVITARSGSKGLPNKNLVLLNDQPLIAWTIEAARKSNFIDRLILSTNCRKIADVGRSWGAEAPFIRPEHLATDTATTVDVLNHTLSTLKKEYDYLVLLQPTSPLRITLDIDQCIKSCIDNDAPSCISASKVEKPLGWLYIQKPDKTISPRFPELKTSRRQDTEELLTPNGAVYVVKTNEFNKVGTLVLDGTIAYLMPVERSIDIDSFFDLKLCEFLLQ